METAHAAAEDADAETTAATTATAVVMKAAAGEAAVMPNGGGGRMEEKAGTADAGADGAVGAGRSPGSPRRRGIQILAAV